MSETPFWKEQYKYALDIWAQESNRFWTRFHVFLLINSGLLTVFSYLLTLPKPTELSSPMFVGVGVIGIIFSIVWYMIIFFGRKWQTLRGKQGEFLESAHHNEIEIKIFTESPYDKESFLRKKLKIKPTITNICYVIPVIFGIIWAIFISYQLLHL